MVPNLVNVTIGPKALSLCDLSNLRLILLPEPEGLKKFFLLEIK